VFLKLGDQSPKPPGIFRFGAKSKFALFVRERSKASGGGEASPRTCFQPLSRRSGCFPAEPYPPLRPLTI
jgi:hypothetical protein